MQKLTTREAAAEVGLTPEVGDMLPEISRAGTGTCHSHAHVFRVVPPMLQRLNFWPLQCLRQAQ